MTRGPGRPTRLDDSIRLSLARHRAEGGSLRGAARQIAAHPSQVSRWRALDADLRCLLVGAELLLFSRALHLLPHEAPRGKMPLEGDLDRIASLATTAIYDPSPEARRDALDLLRASVLPNARVPYVPEITTRLDESAERGWDA